MKTALLVIVVGISGNIIHDSTKLGDIMPPVMIREKSSKAKKIAYDILGIPGAIQNKKSARQKEIDRRLQYDRTAMVR